jgi:hypothetical protein
LIHLADEPEGLIQRCKLCGFILTDYRNAASVGDWKPCWWKGSVEVTGTFPVHSMATPDPPDCSGLVH